MAQRVPSYLYHFGLKAGLPYDFVRGLADAWDRSGHMLESAKRRRLGARLLADSDWPGYLPKDKAYRAFSPGEIPGLNRLVEVGQKIRSQHQAAQNDGIDLGKANPFEVHP